LAHPKISARRPCVPDTGGGAAATQKSLSPTADNRVRRTTSGDDDAEAMKRFGRCRADAGWDCVSCGQFESINESIY